jgi:hypothetical protein
MQLAAAERLSKQRSGAEISDLVFLAILTSNAMNLCGITSLDAAFSSVTMIHIPSPGCRSDPLRGKGLSSGIAVKNCYRPSGGARALPQNDAAVGTAGLTLTHRIPVSFNGDRLFRGRTA